MLEFVGYKLDFLLNFTFFFTFFHGNIGRRRIKLGTFGCLCDGPTLLESSLADFFAVPIVISLRLLVFYKWLFFVSLSEKDVAIERMICFG